MAAASSEGAGALPKAFAVIWSVAALDDLDRIEAYLAQHAPLSARRIRADLVDAGDSLTTTPERGVRVRGAIRKLLITTPWVIRYAVEGDSVVIISVRDGRRRRS